MNCKKFTEKLTRQNSWEDISTFLADDKDGLGELTLERRKNNRDQYCIEVFERKGKSLDGLRRQGSFNGFQPTSSSFGKRSMPGRTNEYNESTSSRMDIGESSRIAKRQKFNPVEVKVVDIESKMVSLEKEISYQLGPDEDTMFMMSLVPTLKSVNPNFKLKAKMEIIKLFDQFPKIEIKTPASNLQTKDESSNTREVSYVDIVDSPVSIQSYESCTSDDDDDD